MTLLRPRFCAKTGRSKQRFSGGFLAQNQELLELTFKGVYDRGRYKGCSPQ